MLTKLIGPEWNNRLVTQITPYDVEKLLNKIAEGRARPHKAKPNNRAHKLQGAKAHPGARQPLRRGAAQDVYLCAKLGLARRQSGLGLPPPDREPARTVSVAGGDTETGGGAERGRGPARGGYHPALVQGTGDHTGSPDLGWEL